jgi:hypothetical protein
MADIRLTEPRSRSGLKKLSVAAHAGTERHRDSRIELGLLTERHRQPKRVRLPPFWCLIVIAIGASPARKIRGTAHFHPIPRFVAVILNGGCR